MHILCPHCRNPIELVKLTPREEIACPSCGSSFRLEAEPTTVASPGLGGKIGRFELLGTLGRGAFGTVFKARDPELDRTVALKVPRPGNLPDGQELDRFVREARSAAQLRHPAIVTVHEVGTDDGRPFLVSDFVEGVTLADQLTARRPAPKDAARLVAAIAEAVHFAHTQGVVHRDLKPSNIMLDAEGRPHVMDFGLAKREAGEITMTLDGQVLGTPAYMSPEQARGEGHRVDGRSDVYSLGVILYQLLTGELPFRGNARMLLHQVLHDDPRPPRSLNDRLPRDLETICLRAMAKEPGRRYATAADLAADLHRFLKGEPIVARPVGRLERALKWARRRPAAAALVGVTVLAVIALAGLAASLAVAQRAADDERREAVKQKGIAEDKERNALKEADKAKKARDFLISIFQMPPTDIGTGKVMTTREILNQAERRIPAEFASQPELRADLLSAIDDVNRNLAKAIPAALILEARGTIQLHSARGFHMRAVPQALLYPEDRLTLAADAELHLVFLADLHKEQMRAGKEVTITRPGCKPDDAVRERADGVLMTFVPLHRATFYRGGGGGKAGTKTEIKEDFEIAVHTVTQGQWQAIMGANPSWFSRTGPSHNNVLGISDEELKLFPVETISWDDTQEFIKRLNEKERGNGYRYRLPTEAEWEYACRGGATSEAECSYLFYSDKPTNDLSAEQANFDGRFPYGKAPQGRYLARPTRVGAYPPNKLGLYDMHGNVFQWCGDAVGEGGAARVFRGGSWRHDAATCRTTHRIGATPDSRSDDLGFRLVRVPVPAR